MDSIAAFFLSLVTMFTQFFGLAGSADYEKLTSLKDKLNLLINKKEIVSEYHNGEKDGESWSADQEFRIEDTTVLKKEKGKDFKILNLTDIHFEDYGYRSVLSGDGETSIRRLVAGLKPDLITVTGDIVCGEADEYSIRKITDMMEGFGVPWAPVFGNHDDEANCDLDYLCDVMMKSPHCLMKKGDPEMGYGNYVVNIAEQNEDGSESIVETLVMMDSHHSMPNEKQRQWYKWVTDGINELTGGKSEFSVFMHIPLPEYQLAYDAAWDADAKKWREGYKACGAKHEDICCVKDENGQAHPSDFFATLKDTGTKYVFCGHEHMNDFSIEYEGIRLTYTMKLGYGSGFQIGFNGGTLIGVGGSGIDRVTHYTLTYGVRIPIEDIIINK